MTIPKGDWEKYFQTLAELSNRAAAELEAYVARAGGLEAVDLDRLIAMAYALATRYGEGASALAAEMYDEIAQVSGVALPAAEAAATATYAEVAEAVTGTVGTGTAETVTGAVGRLVKMAGVDTTMKNAARDGAEWAWVPQGDTCAYCLTMASRGWQKASAKALRGGHARHIHANCDCTYAVRFNEETQVEGYDPEEYRALYENAEGDTPQEKINSLRRADYALRSQEINAQKRAAYARRQERETP